MSLYYVRDLFDSQEEMFQTSSCPVRHPELLGQSQFCHSSPICFKNCLGVVGTACGHLSPSCHLLIVPAASTKEAREAR